MLIKSLSGSLGVMWWSTIQLKVKAIFIYWLCSKTKFNLLSYSQYTMLILLILTHCIIIWNIFHNNTSIYSIRSTRSSNIFQSNTVVNKNCEIYESPALFSRALKLICTRTTYLHYYADNSDSSTFVPIKQDPAKNTPHSATLIT